MFVGAGYAGLEGIAELQDYVADVLDRYPRCRLDGTRWMLVEAQDRVMHEIPASLAAFATRELRGRGMEIRTNTRIEAVAESTRALSTGEEVPTRTLCWTTGVAPAARRGASWGCRCADGGRIEADATCGCGATRTSGRSATPRRCPTRRAAGRPCPPTAQHALRQGQVVADNVAGALAGRPAAASSATARWACSWTWASTRRWPRCSGVRLRGFPAWFAARTYHLAMMPGSPGGCGSWPTGPWACSSAGRRPGWATSATRPPLGQEAGEDAARTVAEREPV